MIQIIEDEWFRLSIRFIEDEWLRLSIRFIGDEWLKLLCDEWYGWWLNLSKMND